ncbi:flagellin [Echinimonas agarilytica]|uniref:Flagellin n=1 Tax=Echinimonas agarilytica TaxID=1215918 RepID=A0AA41W808_9GAMM|nr:flagellin [Echinimonas agarilytica]MCM2680353.1 flagellin [Echinimonas agarilytica]
MAFSIATNNAAITSQSNLRESSLKLDSSLQKLSSGLRINSSKDDAAGLQISNRLSSVISGLSVAIRNANDGISMAQTAEGALQETVTILQRMRNLAIQSANGTNAVSDRKAIQEEISELQKEITRIAETTTFGEQNLLDGSFGSKDFQVGAAANEIIPLTIPDLSGDSIGGNFAAAPWWGADRHSFPQNFVGYTALPPSQLQIAGHVGTTTINIPAIRNTTPDSIVQQVNQASHLTGVTASSYTDFVIEADNIDTHPLTFDLNTNGQTLHFNQAYSLHDIANQINQSSTDIGLRANVENDTLIIRSEAKDNITITDASSNPTGSTALVKAIDRDEPFNSVQETALNMTLFDPIVIHGNIQFSSDSSFSIDSAGYNDQQASLVSVNDIDVSTQNGAQFAIQIVDSAISQVDSVRAELGAVQNRLQHTISNLAVTAENSSASRSRIRDTDYAKEASQQVKQQILQQAGTAITLQANRLPESALSLLEGN